jgi:hypothetical protein
MTTIYFDMDGTIANLYQVEDWLPKLRAFDPSPYIDAETMVDMRNLVRILNRLQNKGYKLGVISWTAAESNETYDEMVRKAKIRWLQKHMPSVVWDEVHIVEYGTPKQSFINCDDAILFDDNEKVRADWTGMAFTEQEIISILKDLLA